MPTAVASPITVGRKEAGNWGWKTDLLVELVGEVSLLAALALLAGLIVRDVLSKSGNTIQGRNVV